MCTNICSVTATPNFSVETGYYQGLVLCLGRQGRSQVRGKKSHGSTHVVRWACASFLHEYIANSPLNTEVAMFIRNVATRLPDAEDLGTATPCRLFKTPAQR